MATGTIQLLDHHQIDQKINRIAYQIYESNYKEKEIVLAGIAPRGIIVAKMLSERLAAISTIKIHILNIDIDETDPAKSKVSESNLEKTINNKVVILVDDVLNTGRTLTYGLGYFLNYSCKKIQTAILVDRNHKKFPIAADFVGLSLATTLQEHVNVKFNKKENVAYLS
ncbi:MAG: phosphoribosyltransferase [Bacteroidetes bacterium]|nr:phosphoribosyltransferase [Bacteroidia bacterium]PCH69593.1 MAG: phosphoribosyltransferase [Bacteroidota bacterium]